MLSQNELDQMKNSLNEKILKSNDTSLLAECSQTLLMISLMEVQGFVSSISTPDFAG